MVGLTDSIQSMLERMNGTLPVNRLTKPTVLQEMATTLVPVYSFRPSPLADQLLAVETFFITFTLTGANNTVQYSSVPVPANEVHRYHHIWVSHNHGSNRRFVFNVLEQRGTSGFIFASGREVEKDIPDGIRTNMLGGQGSIERESHSWNGKPLDLYPGMSFNIHNIENLALLNVTTFAGIRLKMRGPKEIGGKDVTDDYFVNES